MAVWRAANLETVRSRCMAAARLSMRGDSYSSEDRADCAAMLLAELWATARTPSGLNRDDCTMTRLVGMAANRRRSLDRDRARDSLDAANRAAAEFSTDHALPGEDSPWDGEDAAPWTIKRRRSHSEPMRQPHGSPRDVLRYLDAVERVRDSATCWPIQWGAFLRDSRQPVVLGGARCSAMDMLASLGLPRLGRAYPAAYHAARTATGVDVETVARELGCSPDTLRQRVKRSLEAVPSRETHPARLHADLLGVTAQAPTRKQTAAPLEAEERTAQNGAEPSTRRLAGGRRVWNGEAAADWTLTLPASTRRRLRTAAMLSRARVAKRAAAEHAELATAAGESGEVR